MASARVKGNEIWMIISQKKKKDYATKWQVKKKAFKKHKFWTMAWIVSNSHAWDLRASSTHHFTVEGDEL